MKKTAKQINKFMLFFMLHQITMLIILEIVIIITGKSYDLNTLQFFLELLVFLPPLVFYIVSTRSKPRDIFYLKWPGIVNILLVIAITFAAQPILLFLSGLSAIFFPNTTGAFVTELLYLPLGIVLITTSVMPAILEESVFRGLIFSKNSDLTVTAKVLLSALFFALMHLNPQQLLYTFAAGVLFAYMMYITRSIFSSMAAHFTLNATQTILAYVSLPAAELAGTDIPEIPATTALIFIGFLAIASIPIFIFACYLLIVNNKDKIITEKLFAGIKKAAENRAAASVKNTEAAGEAVSVDTASDKSASGEAEGKQKHGIGFKRKIFTWEFWAVITIYVLYMAFIYYPTIKAV